MKSYRRMFGECKPVAYTDVRNIDLDDKREASMYAATPVMHDNLHRLNDTFGRVILANQLGHQRPAYFDTNAVLESNRLNHFNNDAEMQKSAAVLGTNAHVLMKNVNDGLRPKMINKYVENDCVNRLQMAEGESDSLVDRTRELDDAAKDHIAKYCDHVGVTDRYLGYRHNLNRCGIFRPEPTTFENPDGNIKHGVKMAPRYHLVPDRKHVEYQQGIQRPNLNKHTPWPDNITEKCGLIRKFPGESETKERFQRVPHMISGVFDNHGSVQQNSQYTVCPQPHYRIPGRGPCEKRVYNGPDQTEFQTRFQFPDHRLIHRTPWKR